MQKKIKCTDVPFPVEGLRSAVVSYGKANEMLKKQSSVKKYTKNLHSVKNYTIFVVSINKEQYEKRNYKRRR